MTELITSYPKDKIKILLLEGIHPVAKDLLHKAGYDQVVMYNKALDHDELMQEIKDAHLIGIRSKTQLTDAIIQSAPKLLGIGCYCIGTNQVDLTTAAHLGVAVFNSPYSNTRSVAELVIAECIMLLRRAVEKSVAAHSGIWLKDANQSYELRGKKLGIVGYGHIGTQVSVMAEALGMEVVYYDIVPKLPLGNAKPLSSLDQLLEIADIVTLHVPASPDTHNMINADTLKKMKQGSILLNLSRGSVVHITDLVASLKQGHLLGAGLDVFPHEPASKNEKFVSELQNLPNVILTPHIGGSTIEAQENIAIDATSKLLNFIDSGSSVGSHSIPELSLPIQRNTHRILHIPKNVPGVLSEINGQLSKNKINILGQYLKTNDSIGYVVLDVDKNISKNALELLKKVKATIKVRMLY